MRAVLLETPQDEAGWQRWSTHHRDDHAIIRQAIQQQKGVNLTDYQIDPIPLNAVQAWLADNQSFHTDMNGALGVQGSDLEDVDFNDPEQIRAWVFLHYQEHYTAGAKLGV